MTSRPGWLRSAPEPLQAERAIKAGGSHRAAACTLHQGSRVRSTPRIAYWNVTPITRVLACRHCAFLRIHEPCVTTSPRAYGHPSGWCRSRRPRGRVRLMFLDRHASSTTCTGRNCSRACCSHCGRLRGGDASQTTNRGNGMQKKMKKCGMPVTDLGELSNDAAEVTLDDVKAIRVSHTSTFCLGVVAHATATEPPHLSLPKPCQTVRFTER